MSDLEISPSWWADEDNDEVDVETADSERLKLYGTSDIEALAAEWELGESVRPIGMIPAQKNPLKRSSDTNLTALSIRPRTSEEDALRVLASSRNTMSPTEIMNRIATSTSKAEIDLLQEMVLERVRMSGIHIPRPAPELSMYGRIHVYYKVEDLWLPNAAQDLYLLQSPFWILFIHWSGDVRKYAFAMFLGRTNTMKSIMSTASERDRNKIVSLFTPRKDMFAPSGSHAPPSMPLHEYNVGLYSFYGEINPFTPKRSKKTGELKVPNFYKVRKLMYISFFGVENGKEVRVSFFITKNLEQWNDIISDFLKTFRLINDRVDDSLIGFTSSPFPPIGAHRDLVTQSSPSTYLKIGHLYGGLFNMATGHKPLSCLRYIRSIILFKGQRIDYDKLVNKFLNGEPFESTEK